MKKLLLICAATVAVGFSLPSRAQQTVNMGTPMPASAEQPQTEMVVVSGSPATDKPYLPKSAVKTNLLYLATTTLNVGAEFGLAPKWTLDVAAGLNPWDLNERNGGIRHWLVQPEVRYWFCQRFEKHFLGLHGIGGQFQVMDINLHPFGRDLTGKRYDGWGAGAGLSYGYHLPVSKRWAMEFTAGAGYVYLEYDRYDCGECDRLTGSKVRHWFGPTKAGISLIYMIK